MSKSNFLGGVWPVVQRELREGARRPFNYWLRVGAGAAGLLVVVYQTHGRNVGDKEMGVVLFGELHLLLMGLICLVVPWMTADCIAREKREGTLGLLFLTPLTAGGIVAGKGLAQALRALTLWVSAAPVLTIPFLIGGVAWEDATAALALEFSALVLCLAAGLLASTLVRARGAAFVLALLFGAVFVSMFFRLTCFCFAAQTAWITEWGVVDAFYRGGIPPDISFGPSLMSRSALANALAAVSHVWHLDLWASPIPASLIFILVLRFAAWRMARSWQDKIPSALQESLLRRYCTPLFRRRYRRTMQRSLNWNPIAWLQQYSWKARVPKWGLCLAFLLLVVGDLQNLPNSYSQLVHWTALLTLGGIYTFAGVSSFLEEKRSGALELLLVTPISVNKLIFGRVWGLWERFLPAGLVLGGDFAIWHRYTQAGPVSDDALQTPFILACGFLALPVFATYFALRVKNLIVAAVLTWIALWIPQILVMAGVELSDMSTSDNVQLLTATFLSYAAFAILACFLLRHSLSRRIYSF